VVRGKFVYKRDFSITRGIISFDDPLRVDPTLEITAVSEVQNYRVYINMSGRASNPRVDFSIDPPTRQNGTAISKVDILVLLGRGSLPEEQQALGETQNVAATEALGFIWGQLDEPVEKLFDLSGQKVVKEVYFDTYASPEGKPLLRVNLPLNLGEDLDVVLRVDQEQSMKLSSDVSLSENITLGVGVERQSQGAATSEGQTTVPADTGADLKFRFSFP
jgi:translocation and assembly module TamB